jgi:hypothetical protein
LTKTLVGAECRRMHVSCLDGRKPDSVHDWPRTDGPLGNKPANGAGVAHVVAKEDVDRQVCAAAESRGPQSFDDRRRVQGGTEPLSSNATARDGSVYSGSWHPCSSIKHQVRSLVLYFR